MSFGRTFAIKERYQLTVRAEFTNIFNRTEMNNPVTGTATQAQSLNPVTKLPASGFGFISTANTAAPPRQGLIVARFQF